MNLTERETQVLKLLCAGLAHKQIAKRLNMSARTSECLRYKIGKKTGIKSATQLGVWAAKQGIV